MGYNIDFTIFKRRYDEFYKNGVWAEFNIIFHWKNYHWLFWLRPVMLETPSGCLISSKRRDFTLDQRWLDSAGPFAFITRCFHTCARARALLTQKAAWRVLLFTPLSNNNLKINRKYTYNIYYFIVTLVYNYPITLFSNSITNLSIEIEEEISYVIIISLIEI